VFHLSCYALCLCDFTGNSFHAGQKFRVVVDKVVVCSVDTPLAGFGLVFGSYFLFNISYPAEVGATLEYVQRYFECITCQCL
jgi:hypothetical protein